MAIEEFKSGHWYKFINTEREYNFNSDGIMDFVLDRKPHKCNIGKGHSASFFDCEEKDRVWFWILNSWIEVPNPNSKPKKKFILTIKK